MVAERTVVSWDIPQEEKALRARVERHVWGYTSRKYVGADLVEYRYPGLVDHPGGERWGQSVVSLSPEDASGLDALLQEWGVEHLVRPVALRPAGIAELAAAAVARVEAVPA